MGKVLLCTGNYAKTPYCLDSSGIQVYCVEELCVALKKDVFLLDMHILDKKLVKWLGEECNLHDLASELYPLIHQKGSVSAFIGTIMEYVGFYDTEIQREMERTLKEGAGLNFYEKSKFRVDHMAENGRYAVALNEYDKLLMRMPQSDLKLLAGVLHNKAVCLARLFLFEQAAELFKHSYELDPLEKTYEEYLIAVRMYVSDKDYVAFVAGIPDAYDVSLGIEEKLKQLQVTWEEAEPNKRLQETLNEKATGNMKQYEEDMGELTKEIRTQYRRGVYPIGS